MAIIKNLYGKYSTQWSAELNGSRGVRHKALKAKVGKATNIFVSEFFIISVGDGSAQCPFSFKRCVHGTGAESCHSSIFFLYINLLHKSNKVQDSYVIHNKTVPDGI